MERRQNDTDEEGGQAPQVISLAKKREQKKAKCLGQIR